MRQAGETSPESEGTFEGDTVEGMLRFTGAVKRDPAIDRWLSGRPVALGSIATKWFARMRQCGDDVRELIHDGCPVVCVEDAAFGYVNTFKDHVNIGFFHGAALEDPAGLLEGSGKRMRHVKSRPGAEPDPFALGRLIDAAYQDIGVRVAAARRPGLGNRNSREITGGKNGK